MRPLLIFLGLCLFLYFWCVQEFDADLSSDPRGLFFTVLFWQTGYFLLDIIKMLIWTLVWLAGFGVGFRELYHSGWDVLRALGGLPPHSRSDAPSDTSTNNVSYRVKHKR